MRREVTRNEEGKGIRVGTISLPSEKDRKLAEEALKPLGPLIKQLNTLA